MVIIHQKATNRHLEINNIAIMYHKLNRNIKIGGYINDFQTNNKINGSNNTTTILITCLNYF